MSTLNAKVILNVKTAAEWANSIDILLEGELGIESDTRLIKVGNGVDTYISLPYTAASDINDIEGVTVTSPTDGNVLTYSNGEWKNITPSSLPADTDLSHYDNTTSGFITSSDIPALPADTDLSHYDNTNSDFATVSQIPTDVSQLNNDAGYITSSALPSVGDGTITIQKNSVNVDSFTTNQNTNKTINITIPTNVSELNNDAGYVTSATLPTVNNGSLIIRQDGNTIATFTANSATNVVANITGGGGGGGGGASYTSQLTVDSSLIPDTDSVYNLGDSTHRWTYLYSQYLSTGDGSALTAEQSIIPTTHATYNLGSSSKAWRTLYASQIDGAGSSIETNGNIYPSVDEMDILGGSVNKWSEIHTKDLLVYNDFYTDTLKAKTTNGDITVDTNLLPSSTYNLGSSISSWSSGYIDSVYATNIKLTGALTVGIPSDVSAYKRIAIKGYDGNTEGTLTDWAWLGWVTTGVFGFRPVTSNTGTIGTRSEYWSKGFFTELHTSSIYSSYDAVNSVSKIDLYYNTNATESSPVQWGWLGYLSSSEIGIFPSTTNTGLLGSSSYKWNSSYITNLYINDIYSNEEYLEIHGAANTNLRIVPTVSTGNYGFLGSTTDRWRTIYAETLNIGQYTSVSSNNSGKGITFTARNASDDGARYIFFYNDDFYPTNGNAVDLGRNGRWRTIYTNNTVDVSDIRAKDNLEDLTEALVKLNTISVKSYTLNGHDEGIMYGFIAQDELERNPELVVVPKDYSEESDGGQLGYMPNNVLFLAVKAIQELSSKVDELNAKIKVLEGRA